MSFQYATKVLSCNVERGLYCVSSFSLFQCFYTLFICCIEHNLAWRMHISHNLKCSFVFPNRFTKYGLHTIYRTLLVIYSFVRAVSFQTFDAVGTKSKAFLYIFLIYYHKLHMVCPRAIPFGIQPKTPHAHKLCLKFHERFIALNTSKKTHLPCCKLWMLRYLKKLNRKFCYNAIIITILRISRKNIPFLKF